MSIRITELDAITSLQSGDYIAVDNESTGTHKFDALNIGSNIGQNIANTYSSSASYAIGQYCLYDNNLYKCTTTISTPEAWNSSHWIQVTVGEGLYEKVDKVSGKGLSTNDFTDEYKQKLGGIEAGAEVNVQSNWAETNTSSDSYIQNKPGNATTETSGFMSASDKQKLNGIASGAEVNVQANWAETDSSKDDYIKNKPTIDDTLSTSSTNAVENSAIATAINNVTQLVSDEATARENAINDEATARENADIAINEDIGEINTTLETKANIDGSYQEMSVGSAEQLISTVTVDDNAPYVFRTSGGSADIGNREEDKLIGGTMAWNQLIFNGNFASTDGWAAQISDSSLSVSGGVATVTVNSGGVTSYNPALGFASGKAPKGTLNHIYFISVDVLAPISTNLYIGGVGSYFSSLTANSWTQVRKIYKAENLTTQGYLIGYLGCAPTSGITIGDSMSFKNYNVIDLTLLFGSTIANYIYGLEQANAGDGVAWFKQYFPKPYYAYDAGSLQSVNVSSHNMTGFNQWDEEWELGYLNPVTGGNASSSNCIRSKNYFAVFPQTMYYVKVPSSSGVNAKLFFYDIDKNFISWTTKGNQTFETPQNTYFMRFYMSDAYGTTYNNDICINLSWSGYRNGEYELYELHSYLLDDSVELRGLPKLDENNNLYYDGDEYTSDGNVTRKYGIVDLGTLNWQMSAISGVDYFYISLSGKKVNNLNMVCSKYQTSDVTGVVNSPDESITASASSDSVFVRDSAYSSASAFKSAMNGVYLVYELATNMTEEADPYTNPQIVNDFGTEEYVDAGVQAGTRDVSIPVGHYTKYPANLRDKLQHLPDLATQDGEYIITQLDNNMSLKAIDLDQKADIDGYYEEMTVGSAEQLISNVTTEDSKIYTFRTTGGNIDVGDRKTEQLVGGTIVWNQLIKDLNSTNWTTESGVTASYNNGVATITNTSSANNGIYFLTNMVVGHKYLITCKLNATEADTYTIGRGGTGVYVSINLPANSGFIEVSKILPCLNGGSQSNFIYGNGAYNNLQAKDFMLIDLTQMFGTTIADALYAMEQAEAGSGIAWFKKYFPKPYYAYNAGSLQSVNIAFGVNTGFNQWDEEWEVGGYNTTTGAKTSASDKIRCKNPIPIIPNTAYYSKKADWALFFDENGEVITGWSATATTSVNASYIGDRTFVTPPNGRSMVFYCVANYGTTYKNDICINLHWDGERDGEYEPYDAYTYNYDSSLQLRGLTGLDEFGNLVYDGDIYKADGTVIRKFTEFDIATTTVNIGSDAANANGIIRFVSNTSNKKYGSSNVISSLFATNDTVIPTNTDKELVSGYASGVAVYVSIKASRLTGDLTTADGRATAFKNWCSANNFKVIYELETPVEEEANPYINPQIINDWGTEEWVDAYDGRDFLIPPGHNTQYMINLKAKLEMSPNSPDGDGEYIVRQTDGMNEYIPFSWAGEREDLIAGGAQQLISDIYEEDSEPYLFRTSGGSIDIGDREYMDAVVGGTVAWNQLINPTYSVTKDFTESDNYWGAFGNNGKVVDVKQNRIYFVGANANRSIATNDAIAISFVNANYGLNVIYSNGSPNGWHYNICKAVNSGAGQSVLWNNNIGKRGFVTGDTITINNLVCIDLTQMFGTTIADYIYSLEQANAGAGVTWFKKLFNKPYYAYNAGELKSVSGLVSHDMTGFNQMNPERYIIGTGSHYNANAGTTLSSGGSSSRAVSSGINPITVSVNTGWAGVTYISEPLVKGNTYKLACSFTASTAGDIRVTAYILDGNNTVVERLGNYANASTISAMTYTPTEAGLHFAIFIGSTSTQNVTVTNLCCHLVWDASRNGEYEPYELHSYPLDSDLTLRGIPKLDANNNLYYDGDMYESDGTVTRKYGIVDMGALTWTAFNDYANVFYTNIPDILRNHNEICSRYVTTGDSLSNFSDKSISDNIGGATSLWVKDTAYSDASTLKSSLSGVYLVYELATPTTESADPYTSPQIVNDFGTEEFVIDNEIDVPIPVGHNTRYTANLKAKLEMAPDSPNGDGDYIVRQSDGVNTYVPLVIEDALPATPTTNGTYKLIATVTNGEVVLSWESNA